ncbi:hypothetical protein BGZ76_004995 [Entomortierella beljakovae]|nr:hypothetical protein BGZ76_004995 [Entomortierella beljakovae]
MDAPTLAEIQRDEARKQLTITRAKALDQAWQDRKAEIALEQIQDRKEILSVAAASRGSTNAAESSPIPSSDIDDGSPKSAARKQVEEREASRKAGFKPQVQQGDTYQPQAWTPTASRRR